MSPRALLLLLPWLLPLPLCAQHGKALEELIAAFERAAVVGESAPRSAALGALVASGHEQAVAPLAAEQARVSTGLRDLRQEVGRRQRALERHRTVLAEISLRAQRDDTLEATAEEQAERVTELEQELDSRESRLAALEVWHVELMAAAPRLFDALTAPARRKAEGALWSRALDAPSLEGRLSAMEMLGEVGRPGTALETAKLIEATVRERSALQRKLAREHMDLRGLEARMQKETEQLEGRTTVAMVQQYERGRRAAAQTQERLTLISHLLDAATEAGGRALAREQDRDLERSLASLLRSQRGARDGARLRLLELLARADSEPVRVALRELLADEKEAAARAALIDGLSAAADLEIVPGLLERWVDDPSWHVRSRAAHALARLRVREAIPVLIERLEVEQGRLLTDLGAALASLTGRDFHGNVELWRRWWEDAQESFEVPEPALVEPREDAAPAARGTSFFGIHSESESVLFVLDLSGSMRFSLVPRDNPADDPELPPDLPREGEISRIEAAQRELIRALASIPEDGRFNLVLYASDVWTWQDRLVEMRADTRGEVLRFVEQLEPLGATNIHGAIDMALDIAGATGGDTWEAPAIDTIYLLSDGHATVGVTTDSEQILAHVRERNRSAGVVIHTIGLSLAQDSHLLRSLAEQNGGVYVAR